MSPLKGFINWYQKLRKDQQRRRQERFVEQVENWIEEYPPACDQYFIYAQVYLKANKDLEFGYRILNRFLELKPDYTAALALKGDYCVRFADSATPDNRILHLMAAAECYKAAAISPGFIVGVGAAKGVGVSLELACLTEQVIWLDKASELAPLAIHNLEFATSVFGARPHTHVKLGYCLLLIGQLERAQESFKKAADIWDREDVEGMEGLISLQTFLMEEMNASPEQIMAFLMEHMGKLEAQFFLAKQAM